MTDIEKLQAPFPWGEVKYRVGATNADKSRGMVLFYVDARLVAQRLDDVFGFGAWSDDIDVIDDKHVRCRLTAGGVTHADIGESNDGGMADALKSAASDAFKRAAVKFGIGRYLYERDDLWVRLERRGNTSVIDERDEYAIERHYRRMIGEKVEDGAHVPAGRRARQDEPRATAGRPAPAPASQPAARPRVATQQERTKFWQQARALGFDGPRGMQLARGKMPQAPLDMAQWTAAMFDELLAALQHEAARTAA